ARCEQNSFRRQNPLFRIPAHRDPPGWRLLRCASARQVAGHRLQAGPKRRAASRVREPFARFPQTHHLSFEPGRLTHSARRRRRIRERKCAGIQLQTNQTELTLGRRERPISIAFLRIRSSSESTANSSSTVLASKAEARCKASSV